MKWIFASVLMATAQGQQAQTIIDKACSSTIELAKTLNKTLNGQERSALRGLLDGGEDTCRDGAIILLGSAGLGEDAQALNSHLSWAVLKIRMQKNSNQQEDLYWNEATGLLSGALGILARRGFLQGLEQLRELAQNFPEAVMLGQTTEYKIDRDALIGLSVARQVEDQQIFETIKLKLKHNHAHTKLLKLARLEIQEQFNNWHKETYSDVVRVVH